MIGGRFIGRIGRLYVYQRMKVGWGSKNFRKFNEAMLAKQVWRLIHDKDSLSTKFSKLNFSYQVTYFLHKLSQVLMLGAVSLVPGK